MSGILQNVQKVPVYIQGGIVPSPAEVSLDDIQEPLIPCGILQNIQKIPVYIQGGIVPSSAEVSLDDIQELLIPCGILQNIQKIPVYIQGGIVPSPAEVSLDDMQEPLLPLGVQQITLKGTAGTIPKFTGTTIADSIIIEFNSNIGIGTPAPIEILEIHRDINAATQFRIRNDAIGTAAHSAIATSLGNWVQYAKMASLSSGFTANGLLVANANVIYSLGATAGLRIFTADARDLTLGTNLQANVTIQNGGKVGIGTTTMPGNLNLFGPAATFLNIASTAGCDAYINIQEGEGVNKWACGHRTGSGNFFIYGYGAGTDVFVINPAGTDAIFKNIDTSAHMMVSIKNNSDKQLALISYGDTAGGNILGNTRSGAAVVLGYNNPSALLIGTYEDKPVVFAQNNVEIARLAVGGNFGIGTTLPTSKLHVVGLPIYATNALAIVGGLTAGAFYRSGGDPDILCVVH